MIVKQLGYLACIGLGLITHEVVSANSTCLRNYAECGVLRSQAGTSVSCGSCEEGFQCVANRCESSCSKEAIGQGPYDDLFMWIPLQLTDSDYAQDPSKVTIELLDNHHPDPVFPFTSQVDLSARRVMVDFEGKKSAVPFTIFFKLMPSSSNASHTLIQASQLRISTQDDSIVSEILGDDASFIHRSDASQLKTRSCNAFGLVVSDTELISYFNGHTQTAALEAGLVRPLAEALAIGAYPGKLWDLRVYQRALSEEEMHTLGADCSDSNSLASPWPEYPNYLCATYNCIFWPEGVTDTTLESFQYQVNAHDMTWEHNVLASGMYRHGAICSEFAKARNLQMTEGYRRSWVSKYNYAKPWGNYVLHENFHAFQARAGGGSKFLAESSANWGAYAMKPGTDDNSLLGMYTLQPHLPLYTTQSSPIADDIVDAFKGGHQYGAGIFFFYLTHFLVSKRLVGMVFNDERRFQEPTAAVYEFLSAAGYDLREIFMDFAARTTTWDYGKYSPGWIAAEESSYRRMERVNRGASEPWPDEEVDNKIAVFYGPEGTGANWVAVPERYRLGAWSYNAYELSAEQDGKYAIGVRQVAGNLATAEFRAKAVVLRADGQRLYHPVTVQEAGGGDAVELELIAGDKLYLVVASTPSQVFSGWDTFRYQYLIRPLAPSEGLGKADVGPVEHPGSLTIEGNDLRLKASGGGIDGQRDEFFFAYKILSGDGAIEVHVDTVERINDWAKAGIMVRENLNASAPHVALLASGHGRSILQWRELWGEATGQSLHGPGAPKWLRIVRQGNEFVSYTSTDRANWAELGRKTVEMADSVLVGIAGTSHTADRLMTAELSGLNFSGNISDGDGNTPPEAIASSHQLRGGQTVEISLEGKDRDGDQLSFQVISPPTHGNLSGNAPSLTYTPDANYHGPDQLSFRVSDGSFASNIATVSFVIKAPENAAKVFLLAGQSNMVGHGANNDLNHIDATVMTPRTDVFIANIMEGARPLDGLRPGYGANGSRFGVELKLGHALGDLFANDVVLFKASRGGTTLDNIEHWRPPAHGGSDKNLYVQMLSGFRSFLKDNFEAKGLAYEIAGFVWFQGFNDTFGAEHRYEGHLRNFLAAVRDDLERPDLPIAIVQINDVRGAAGDVVMAAQERVAADNQLNTLVSTRDQRPYFHYGSYSYYTIGDRIAHALVPYLGSASAVPDEYDTPRGSELVVAKEQGLLHNDLPAFNQGSTLSVSLVTPPRRGALTLNADGSFRYRPLAFFIGPDTFTYRIKDTDGTLGSVARVRIWVRDRDDSLVLHYPFDAANAASFTDIASGIKARMIGSGITAGHSGKIGSSAKFTGQGALHFLEEYPPPSFLQLSTAVDFSILSWVKLAPTGTANPQIILSNKYWSGRGGGFALSTGHDRQDLRMLLSPYDHATHRFTSIAAHGDAKNIGDGAWHHIAAVANFSGSKLKLYVDAMAVGEADISGLKGDLERFEAAIGDGASGGDGNSHAFAGWLDDLRIYRRALSTAEIKALTGINHPPTVDAGPDRELHLPDSKLSILGKVDDPDGRVVATKWWQISGPSLDQQVLSSSIREAHLILHDLTAGEYQFGLEATDDTGASSQDTVRILVHPQAGQ